MSVVGEVVIVKDEDIPRGSWKLARIQSLIKSEVDGIEKDANLMSSSGKTFRRPFRLIFLLKRRNEDHVHESTKMDDVTNQTLVKDIKKVNETRPPRNAAVVAARKIKTMQ